MATPKKSSWLQDNYHHLAAGFSLIAGISQGRALEAQGDYENHVAKMNAASAERSAEETEKVGKREANRLKGKVGDIEAEQRAAFAAQGVDVSQGSAADVQLGTMLEGIEDARIIRNNAMREALGLKLSAVESRHQGAMAKIGAKNAAAQSLASGGLQAMAMYKGYGK